MTKKKRTAVTESVDAEDSTAVGDRPPHYMSETGSHFYKTASDAQRAAVHEQHMHEEMHLPHHGDVVASMTPHFTASATATGGSGGRISGGIIANNVSSPSLPSGLKAFVMNSPNIDLESRISSMKTELLALKEEEDEKRTLHIYCKNDLQYVWDQLVSMKTLITTTKQMLEEATLEELLRVESSANALAADLSDDVLSGRIGLTAAAAAKAVSANILKAKIDMKDDLKNKIIEYEEHLNNLRKRLSLDTDSLIKATNYTKTVDGVLGGDSSVAPIAMSSMELRQSLIAATIELESAEAQYVKSLEKLSILETEIGAILEESATGGEGCALRSSSSSSSSAAAAVSAPLVSVHEALSDSNGLKRVEGEPLERFLPRAHARLQLLTLLDRQLQDDLEKKTDGVRRARDGLREVEVQRLRMELQLSSIDARLSQLRVEDLESELLTRVGRTSLAESNRSSSGAAKKGGAVSSGSAGSPDRLRVDVMTTLLREDIQEHLDPASHQTRFSSGKKKAAINSRQGQHITREGGAPRSIVADRSLSPVKTRVSLEVDTARMEDASPRTRHRSVLAIAGRLEQLANRFEDDNSLGSNSNRALMGMLEKQQKEINELKIQRKYESADGSRSILKPKAIRLIVPSPADSPVRSTGETGRYSASGKYTYGARLGSAASSSYAKSSSALPSSASSANATSLSSPDNVNRSPSRVHKRENSDSKANPDGASNALISRSNNNSKRIIVPSSSSAATVKISTTAARHTYKNVSPTKSEESVEAMEARLARYRARLETALSTEVLNEDGLSVNPTTLESLGYVEVNVIAARSLPPLKKISKSADPYVELCLVAPSATWVDESCVAVAGEVTEDYIGSLEGKQQTSVKWKELFPEWRESFRLGPVTDLCQAVLLAIRDHSRLGYKYDEVIGSCSVPLQDLLDQRRKKAWIALQAPEVRKLSTARLSESCAILVDLRLVYCRVDYWKIKVRELEVSIQYLRGIGASTSRALVSPIDFKNASEPSRSGGGGDPIPHSDQGTCKSTAAALMSPNQMVSRDILAAPHPHPSSFAAKSAVARSMVGRLTGLRERDNQHHESALGRSRSHVEPSLTRLEVRDEAVALNGSFSSNAAAAAASRSPARGRSRSPTRAIDKAATAGARSSRSQSQPASAEKAPVGVKRVCQERSASATPTINRANFTQSKAMRQSGTPIVAPAPAPTIAPVVNVDIFVKKRADNNATKRISKPNLNIFRGSRFQSSAHGSAMGARTRVRKNESRGKTVKIWM